MGSKYLIRLKKNSFINQRKYIRGDDETIQVNWINSRLKEFVMKNYAKKQKKIKS